MGTRKLNALHLGYHPKNNRYSNDSFMFKELAKQTNLIFIDIIKKNPKQLDGQLSKIFRKNKIDFIYKNFVGSALDSHKLRPLHEYGVPIFVSSGDCHTRLLSDVYNKRSNYHKFNHVVVNNHSTISCFKDYFDRKLNFIWLPWAYNPSIHRNYKGVIKHDVCIPAGSLRIKIRNKIHNFLSKNNNYTWIKGLPPVSYAKSINRCSIGVSSCQVESRLYYKKKFIGMTFNKYYEIPMCNTFHIGQKSGDADRLGFVDGKNIVMYDTYNEFVDKFSFYLKNKKARITILKNARKHILPMTYENRMRNFLSEVSKYI